MLSVVTAFTECGHPLPNGDGPEMYRVAHPESTLVPSPSVCPWGQPWRTASPSCHPDVSTHRDRRWTLQD